MGGTSALCPQRRAAVPEGVRYFQRDFIGITVRDSFKGDPDIKHRCWILSQRFFRPLMYLVASLIIVTLLLIHGSGVVLFRANNLGRQCFETPIKNRDSLKKYKIAMVTASDESGSIPTRSFQGLMKLVEPNKKSYAQSHGYDFIDASDAVDKNRPPSWSKILAVRNNLPNYDWIFWNDADSLVTNPNIYLEDVLYSITGDMDYEKMPDFIVTEDVTGVNAGMFFFRNSEWSRMFLDRWWNATGFIRPPGQSKSGDNDALKHLIKTMPQDEKKHVRIPRMQCVFNSNMWSPSWKSSHRLMTLTKTVWQGVYAKGDFMVHLAGLNDKKKWVRKILHELEEEKGMFKNRIIRDISMIRF
ncbi:hypothetical protein KI387_005137 [Taxus chinensis]|uniref:Uncharacterized protein n=1 Tax=Taxus chinensis TaxID=29808 RepID=A0AA38GMG2_TAXCH|nr:hypothetical protein KI387_005137 [Taxus chinensis]